MSHKWEILIGDTKHLDHLATKYAVEDAPHYLQEELERIIAEELTDDEREVFLMRFGEEMTIRDIAEAQGYSSHYVIQWKLESIYEKVRNALGEY